MKKFIIVSFLAFSFFTISSAYTFAGEIKSNNNLLKKHEYGNTSLFSKSSFRADAEDAFIKDKVVISAGYGFPNLGKAIMTVLIGDGTEVVATGVGPLHFKGEYGLSDGVGMGLSVNYVSFGATWRSTDSTGMGFYTNKFSRSSLSVLARINFHFGTTDKLDPYFGVGAGYRQATWKFTSNDPDYADDIKAPGFSPFGFETTIGLRYYIAEGIGLYTEMGIAKSIIQVGLVAAF